jgi:3-hydroxy-3-methylglutaryl CoA synthase
MRRYCNISANSYGSGAAGELYKWTAITRMEDSRFRRRHDAIAAGAFPESSEVMLRIERRRSVRTKDERGNMESTLNSGGRSNNHRDRMT